MAAMYSTLSSDFLNLPTHTHTHAHTHTHTHQTVSTHVHVCTVGDNKKLLFRFCITIVIQLPYHRFLALRHP